MTRNWIVDFMNPAKDTQDIDATWYRRQINGTPDELNQATKYLLTRVPVGLVEHFGRGAIAGGLVGLTCSGTGIGALAGGILGGTIDWTQYGVRAMLKISKCYID